MYQIYIHHLLSRIAIYCKIESTFCSTAIECTSINTNKTSSSHVFQVARKTKYGLVNISFFPGPCLQCWLFSFTRKSWETDIAKLLLATIYVFIFQFHQHLLKGEDRRGFPLSFASLVSMYYMIYVVICVADTSIADTSWISSTPCSINQTCPVFYYIFLMWMLRL